MECVACGSEIRETRRKSGRKFFVCGKGHELPRADMEDESLSTTRRQGEEIPEVVGVAVFTEEKLLVIKRNEYPFQYTMPFVHIKENEDPAQAGKRALRETVGLNVKEESLEETGQTLLESKCVKGHERHSWRYLTFRMGREADLEPGEEIESAYWMNLYEFEDYGLTYPTEHLLQHEYL